METVNLRPAVPLNFLSSTPSSFCSIEESYKYIFLPICYTFTFIFSISLNSVVLFRSFCKTKRWNASLIYMANLACTDLMYGLSLPFLVTSYIMHDHWVFGDFMCRLVRFLFYFNLYCSISFLTCISIHRYIGICHPMKVITLETKKAVKCTSALVWIIVFALTCPIFQFAETGHVTRLASVEQNNAGLTKNNKSIGLSTLNSNVTNASIGHIYDGYQNCWDDAIDKEFKNYVPYGIILHFFGFFVPFSIIAWCYTNVILAIFKSLHSQPLFRISQINKGKKTVEKKETRNSVTVERKGSELLKAMRKDEDISVFMRAPSSYVRQRRKSIKTIITITLLFALCFFPFHVTRTIFLLLKVTKRVSCQTMTMVSMCYKVTRPLASFNAWLNALLYFLTNDKLGMHCCPAVNTRGQQHSGLLIPLKNIGKREGGFNVHIDQSKNKKVQYDI